jgi:hypothetical protein
MKHYFFRHTFWGNPALVMLWSKNTAFAKFLENKIAIIMIVFAIAAAAVFDVSKKRKK